MKMPCPINLIALICIIAPSIHAKAPQQHEDPLRLIQTIPLPNVKGRIDHMEVDVKGKRLFVAGLENDTLEVIDLQSGKWVRSVPGLRTPQGIAYVPALNKVFVANENDNTLKVFRGDTFVLLNTIRLERGGNRIAYDPRTQDLYVGYGGASAKRKYGEIGIIDPKNDKLLGNIQVGLRPAEILMDESGQTLFVLDSHGGKIQVIDAGKRRILSTWPLSSQHPGDAAFDESTHRLFIGARTPPIMIVMDPTSGKEIEDLPTAEGMDGIYFDVPHKRIYVSGGRGFNVGYVFVYQQQDADHYTQTGKIPTRPGAGTSFWSPDFNRYYVAAPARDKEEASILVFEPRP